MPFISRFYGIVIYLYANDHEPPHFHAKYTGQEVAVEIETLRIIVGGLPLRAMRMVREWATAHQQELRDNWDRLRRGELPTQIEPLP